MALNQDRALAAEVGKSTSFAPKKNGTMVMRIRPMSWYTGSQLTKQSEAKSCIPAINCSTFVSSPRWDDITPLGMPVLPDVYWRNATWSGPVSETDLGAHGSDS